MSNRKPGRVVKPVEAPTPVDRIRQVARDKFGFDHLRPGQEQTIRDVLDGHGVLAIMPTGSGKSAVCQIAAMLLDGPVVVISPLLALQEDQVESTNERQPAGAAAVNSAQRAGDRRRAFESLDKGSLKFIFVGPEQLQNKPTRVHLLAHRPALFVVDEAQSVSEWGREFRPE